MEKDSRFRPLSDTTRRVTKVHKLILYRGKKQPAAAKWRCRNASLSSRCPGTGRCGTVHPLAEVGCPGGAQRRRCMASLWSRDRDFQSPVCVTHLCSKATCHRACNTSNLLGRLSPPCIHVTLQRPPLGRYFVWRATWKMTGWSRPPRKWKGY